MPVRVMRPGGLFTKARNCGTPRAFAPPRNQRSGACRVQSYFPSAISNVSAVRQESLILSVMPPPTLNRQQESPIPPVCEKSKSATRLRLGTDHVPSFCMLQQSEAEKFSMAWYSESRRMESRCGSCAWRSLAAGPDSIVLRTDRREQFSVFMTPSQTYITRRIARRCILAGLCRTLIPRSVLGWAPDCSSDLTTSVFPVNTSWLSHASGRIRLRSRGPTMHYQRPGLPGFAVSFALQLTGRHRQGGDPSHHRPEQSLVGWLSAIKASEAVKTLSVATQNGNAG